METGRSTESVVVRVDKVGFVSWVIADDDVEFNSVDCPVADVVGGGKVDVVGIGKVTMQYFTKTS